MSEKKYIDAELFRKLITESVDVAFSDEATQRFLICAIINKSVDLFPAADVEPVVRGELRINDQGFLECSACGKTLRMPLVSTHEMKRCYICGAYLERSGSGE